MFTSEFLVQLFIVVVVVNIAIVEVALFLLWRRGRVGAPSSAAADSRMELSSSSSLNGPADAEIPALTSGASADGSPPDATTDAPPDHPTDGDDHAAPTSFVDADTGLETAVVWYDALRHEDARRARYGHPATVMVMELVGFELLGERLGPDVADRLIVPVATTLLRNSRASDRIARVGHTRFQVLMPETDEISAINYVERVREATDMWLEAGAVAVRTAIGWASPPSGGSLIDAAKLADERMQADRHARARHRANGAHSRQTTPAAV